MSILLFIMKLQISVSLSGVPGQVSITECNSKVWVALQHMQTVQDSHFIKKERKSSTVLDSGCAKMVEGYER